MNSGCKDTKNYPFYKIFRGFFTGNSVEWIKNNRTLIAIVDDLNRREISKGGKSLSIKRETSIMNKYNQIADRLMDYGIESITVGDITDFIKRKLALEKDIKLSDKDIISFIMDEQNREDLTELGAKILGYYTSGNDAWQRENGIGIDGRW